MPLAAPSWRASFLKRLTKARLMQGDVDGAARAAQTVQNSAAEVDLPFCKLGADSRVEVARIVERAERLTAAAR